MIRVSGTARVYVNYEIELEMTEEEFDELSERKQNDLIDAAVDWMDACRDGEVDDIEIDEIDEIDEEEESA